MTATLDDAPTRRRTPTRRWSLTNVIVAGIIFAGICVLVYPTAGNWFSDLAHSSDVSGYVERVDGASPEELAQQLADARSYNENLPNGPLRDPYILNASGQSVSLEEGWNEYRGQLALSPDSPMARIRIPQIGVDLPIFHGTDEPVLSKGVGHLYGSALPVGGEGSHSVLTGHAGRPGADLFTHLHELAIGDLFYVEVAGDLVAYRVDQIETVEPDDGEELRQVQGRDYVTLLTCTPIGVNSHRLLVRGERVDVQQEEDPLRALPPEAADPGFPWWVLALSGGAGVACAIAWPRRQAVPERNPGPVEIGS